MKVLSLNSLFRKTGSGIQEKFETRSYGQKIDTDSLVHDMASKIKNGKYKGETLKDVYLNHRKVNDPYHAQVSTF